MDQICVTVMMAISESNVNCSIAITFSSPAVWYVVDMVFVRKLMDANAMMGSLEINVSLQVAMAMDPMIVFMFVMEEDNVCFQINVAVLLEVLEISVNMSSVLAMYPMKLFAVEMDNVLILISVCAMKDMLGTSVRFHCAMVTWQQINQWYAVVMENVFIPTHAIVKVTGKE